MAPEGRVEFDPKEIARAGFPTAFRGYEQESVRRYLVRLAAAIGQAQKQGSLDSIGPAESAQIRVAELEHETSVLRERIQELASAPEHQVSAPLTRELDEDELIELLGSETARIVASARSAASEIVGRAEEEAAAAVEEASATLAQAREEASATLAQAREEAARTVSAAEAEAVGALGTARAEADDVLHQADVEARKLEAQVSAEVQRRRDEAHDEAERICSEAAVRADNEMASARRRSAQLVAEAEQTRDEILSDLVRRRRAGRAQLERLAEARALLAAALVAARDDLDEVADDLQQAAPADVDIDLTGAAPTTDDTAEVAELVTQLERNHPGADGGAVGSPPAPDLPLSPADHDDRDTGAREPASRASRGVANGHDESSVDLGDLVALDAEGQVLTTEGPVTVGDLGSDDLFDRLGTPVLGRESGSLQRQATRGDLPSNHPFLGPLPAAFEGRDVVLVKATPGFKRRLKRAVNDDQSHVLDRLRAGRGAIIADELPPLDEQLDGYVKALRPVLMDVVTSGSELLDRLDIPAPAVENLCLQLGKHIVDCLRLPTIDVIEDDGTDDREAVLDPVRAIYRDFRNSLLPDLIDDALHEAFALGLYHAIDQGTPVIWMPDPRLDPDPICEENSASPALAKGSEFPSGHPRPLSMPGCRCLVVPA
jgi:DivIVA domain-containing protein